MGLYWDYRRDVNILHNIKCFRALAFVPLEEVHNCFNAFINSKVYLPILDKYVEYLIKTWLGRPARDRFDKPVKARFPPKYWNLNLRLAHNSQYSKKSEKKIVFNCLHD